MISGKNFTGLQGKISFVFIGVFILIILPFNTIIYLRVKQLLVEADTRELAVEGERLLGQVQLDPPVVPLPSVGYSIFLQVGDLAQSDSLFASPNFPASQAGLIYQDVMEIDTFKIVTISQPVPYRNANLYFSIARSNQRLSSNLSNLRGYLFLGNIVSILIAGLLVYAVSGISLRPIRKIIETTQHINASKSIERVPIPDSKDENHQLALAINDMLKRIEVSINNQTNFFASAAHELKTPLSVMQVELSIALQKSADPGVSALLQSQLNEVERLNRVIQDFLLISQLKTDTIILRKQEGRLDEVVYSSMKRTKYLLQERKIQVRVTLQESEQATEACFDPDKMETIISNLIENAVKYSPTESVVVISLSRQGAQQCLTIKNPTTGLIHNINELKSEFRKSNELSSGLGLGLWICDRLLNLHGGTLTLLQANGHFEARVVV